MHVYICIYICICIQIYPYIYINIFVCVYTYIHVYIYVCIRKSHNFSKSSVMAILSCAFSTELIVWEWLTQNVSGALFGAPRACAQVKATSQNSKHKITFSKVSSLLKLISSYTAEFWEFLTVKLWGGLRCARPRQGRRTASCTSSTRCCPPSPRAF